jgi:polysaccharide biosynthesis protein PslH
LKRILIVSFIFPYPVTSGGSHDIMSRIKLLCESGYQVDLLTTTRDLPDEKSVEFIRSMVNELWVVPRSRAASALFSCKPFHYKTRQDLKSVRLTGQYSAVILESEFVGAILENPTLLAKHVVLRVHNDEAHLHRALASDAAGVIHKFLFLVESFKFMRYSPRLMKRCDELWYISNLECQKASFGPFADKSRILPIHISSERFKRQELASHKVLYVGALSVPINQYGLIWYLTKVHPQLLSISEYELIIAGRTGHASIKELCGIIESSRRVSVHLDVMDLSPLYSSCSAFINPIRRGAGVKIKTIEAAIVGLPVITTSAGAEGTGFVNDVHAVIADSAGDFARGVRDVLADKARASRLVDAAQLLLAQCNDPDRLLSLVERFM